MRVATTRSATVSPSGPTTQSSHFDVAIAAAAPSTGLAREKDRPVRMLEKGLSALKRITASIDRDVGDGGGMPEQDDRDTAGAGGTEARVLSAAAKLLCVEDALFDTEGGSQVARDSIASARRAGRTIVVLCTDQITVFRKRREIWEAIGQAAPIVAGEPRAVLPLFAVMRIDTLVQEVMRSGTGLVIHRAPYPSILVRPGGKTVETSGRAISSQAFWSEFLPGGLDKYLG